MGTNPSTLPVKSQRSIKPLAVKGQVIAARVLGDSYEKIARDLSISVNTVKRIIGEHSIESKGKDSVESIFAKHGLTIDKIAAHAAQGLAATETRTAQFEGKFTDTMSVPDHVVQHKYWQDSAKILGLFPREDATAQAALFVKLPMNTLTPGHAPSCLCDQCAKAWDSYAITVESGKDTDSER